MAHTKKHHYRRPPVEDQLEATDRIGKLLGRTMGEILPGETDERHLPHTPEGNQHSQDAEMK